MKIAKLLGLYILMLIALSYLVELASNKTPFAWIGIVLIPAVVAGTIYLGTKLFDTKD